jgi:hypothetical protein
MLRKCSVHGLKNGPGFPKLQKWRNDWAPREIDRDHHRQYPERRCRGTRDGSGFYLTACSASSQIWNGGAGPSGWGKPGAAGFPPLAGNSAWRAPVMPGAAAPFHRSVSTYPPTEVSSLSARSWTSIATDGHCGAKFVAAVSGSSGITSARTLACAKWLSRFTPPNVARLVAEAGQEHRGLENSPEARWRPTVLAGGVC